MRPFIRDDSEENQPLALQQRRSLQAFTSSPCSSSCNTCSCGTAPSHHFTCLALFQLRVVPHLLVTPVLLCAPPQTHQTHSAGCKLRNGATFTPWHQSTSRSTPHRQVFAAVNNYTQVKSTTQTQTPSPAAELPSRALKPTPLLCSLGAESEASSGRGCTQ